jgi:hypothetical protein
MRALAVWSLILCAGGCGARNVPPEAPAAEAGRHRAALASISVANETSLLLEIAFRTAVPPLQEIVIGRVAPGSKVALAPVPAGEPIIMIARRDDGAEYQSKIQSFPLDGTVVWSIPKNATFVMPARPE